MRTLISFKNNYSLNFSSRVYDSNWEPPVTPPAPPTGPQIQSQEFPERDINVPPATKSHETETE